MMTAEFKLQFQAVSERSQTMLVQPDRRHPDDPARNPFSGRTEPEPERGAQVDDRLSGPSGRRGGPATRGQQLELPDVRARHQALSAGSRTAGS